jgi:hypothetical protein
MRTGGLAWVNNFSAVSMRCELLQWAFQIVIALFFPLDEQEHLPHPRLAAASTRSNKSLEVHFGSTFNQLA